MPGIVGFTKTCPEAGDGLLLQRMIGCMMHEASYASGTYATEEVGVSAGFVDCGDSSAGCAWNEARDIGLLISGDLFGDPPLPRPDRLKGLISAYERAGVSCLEHINGWFSGVLLDLRNRTAVLFNDRYGLGRVYYHQTPEAFYFGSEAKALLQVLPHTRRLDDRGVAEWLSCGCVLQNRTLFSGIELLPPGSAWTFSPNGKLTKGRYFNPASWESQPALTPAEYYEQLKETFPRILRRYLNSPQPVAMSLTGGLDGRMIMSWSDRRPGELPCYTFNGPVRDCADVKIARQVALACGQPHHAIHVDERFFAEFPKLAEEAVYITDGAMDVIGAAELYLNRVARQIAPVRLTGNYGSEILRRYVAFRPRTLKREIFLAECVRDSEAASRTYSEEAGGNRLSFIAFKQVPWHHFARFAVERSQLAVRSPYLDNELVALAFRAPPSPESGLEDSLRLIADGNPQLGRIPTDRGITYPAGRTTNRLHRSLQEFLAKAEYAYDYGMPDWLVQADRYLAPLHLERLFLGRQKFCHFRSWYRHQLSGYVQDILLDPPSRQRNYLEGSCLKTIVKRHLAGSANYTLEIHKLLSLELLQRSLLEKPAGRAAQPPAARFARSQPALVCDS